MTSFPGWPHYSAYCCCCLMMITIIKTGKRLEVGEGWMFLPNRYQEEKAFWHKPANSSGLMCSFPILLCLSEWITDCLPCAHMLLLISVGVVCRLPVYSWGHLDFVAGDDVDPNDKEVMNLITTQWAQTLMREKRWNLTFIIKASNIK